MDLIDTTATAERLGVPVEWVQMHLGRHRCVDNKWYTYSCLVTDPECEGPARSYMRMSGILEEES